MLLVLNLTLDTLYRAPAAGASSSISFPIIMFFSLMGVYLVSFNVFDIHMMVFIAISAAVLLRLLAIPDGASDSSASSSAVCLEDNLRRALAVADGQFSFLWDRPTTTVVLMSSGRDRHNRPLNSRHYPCAMAKLQPLI